MSVVLPLEWLAFFDGKTEKRIIRAEREKQPYLGVDNLSTQRYNVCEWQMSNTKEHL